jgi:Rod binding domain-containing protein
MNVIDTHPKLRASELPLEMLAGNKEVSDKEKIGEVARQFEAVLLRQILQEAHKSGSSDNKVANGVYDDMINNQLADTISRSGNFGLAKSLEKQLTHQVLPHADTKPGAPLSQPSHKMK